MGRKRPGRGEEVEAGALATVVEVRRPERSSGVFEPVGIARVL